MIQKFEPHQQEQLANFVLGIQNGEFGLGFKRDEQKDLLNTSEFYKGGNFWIAKNENDIIGCIGLQKLNSEVGVLRKMFVQKEFRGKELNIAQQLFEKLKQEAINLKFEKILLDTPSIAKASHRFYQRNGFIEIRKNEIPSAYSFPDRNSKIFELKLK
ncbi:GNAT family N-acetyltransferase [Tenacibaculum amylolyticum]|uniref:GNAT family N-acetyltransferase n=1 Tax=Tenacibaculum amylolyticum TaxID=104269 RepID=UPI0038949AE3